MDWRSFFEGAYGSVSRNRNYLGEKLHFRQFLFNYFILFLILAIFITAGFLADPVLGAGALLVSPLVFYCYYKIVSKLFDNLLWKKVFGKLFKGYKEPDEVQQAMRAFEEDPSVDNKAILKNILNSGDKQ